RFLMNVMLASGGYPWTVIPLETRMGKNPRIYSTEASNRANLPIDIEITDSNKINTSNWKNDQPRMTTFQKLHVIVLPVSLS
ncbi:MAG: hypothetical protein DRH90_22195, partial [Deltaproteobacteria bacterium]